MRTNPPCKRSEYWGRGGAGVLFTCSEDGTVLLLLRAEWVEQGGTWGIPGGGIGEGFYDTPMEPITDLDVFRRKAEQEAEEECGALPPYMTRLPEGLPYTQYEDCGFRYVTFILDIPKATKEAWAPYSADGENDAFVWFPLAEVKRGRPLPDEYGDLHDIHFGVKFTMDNLPPRANPRPSRRRNPVLPQTETPAFKRWFGKSVVVDESGAPLVVYHGTGKAFDTFDPARLGEQTGAGNTAMGFFFAEDYDLARELYAGKRGEVMEVYLSIQKPLRLRDAWDNDMGAALRIAARDYLDRDPETAEDWWAFRDYLRDLRGIDGVEFVGYAGDPKYEQRVYLAFEPTQIKSAIGNRGTFDPADPDIRHNPMRFDLQYTPEEADRYRDSRAVRSLLSPALQRRNVERMVDTPHNFVVVVQEDGEGSALPLFEDAVTLSLSLRGVHNNDFDFAADEDKRVRESLYTAFTILHRFGDTVFSDLWGSASEGNTQDSYWYVAEKRPRDAVFSDFYEMLDAHVNILLAQASTRKDALLLYKELLGRSVNSKMVREGYSGSWGQGFADLFPLCELTPSTRPLLISVTGTDHLPYMYSNVITNKVVKLFNKRVVPDFNVRFRAFYNNLIPSLYGTARGI